MINETTNIQTFYTKKKNYFFFVVILSNIIIYKSMKTETKKVEKRGDKKGTGCFIFSV